MTEVGCISQLSEKLLENSHLSMFPHNTPDHNRAASSLSLPLLKITPSPSSSTPPHSQVDKIQPNPTTHKPSKHRIYRYPLTALRDTYHVNKARASSHPQYPSLLPKSINRLQSEKLTFTEMHLGEEASPSAEVYISILQEVCQLCCVS